jgi:uncharacterized protein (TIRG00374 family)
VAVQRDPGGLQRQALRYSLGLLLGAGALWYALGAAGGPSTAWRALEQTHLRWLVPAVLAESLGFVVAAARLRRLAGRDVSLSLPAATGLELVMNGLGLLTPTSPVEGLAYGARQLRRRGLDGTRTALVLALEQWFTYRVIYLVAAINLLVILASRDFPVPGPWPVLGAVTALLLLAGTSALASKPATMEQLSRAWGRVRFWRPSPTAEERQRTALRLHLTMMGVLGPRRNRVELVAMSLVVHLAGVLTLLLSMRAVGLTIDLDLALLATATGIVASSIPLLPGGVGVVEAVVPALLHWYGAPLDQALAGALVARVLSTGFPAAAGVGALWMLRLRDRTSG